MKDQLHKLLDAPRPSRPEGFYPPEPQMRLLADGRNMELLEPITYVSPDGKEWPVPAGIVSDGVSIPDYLSFVGSAWGERWRLPAIYHDHYCRTRSESAPDTHRMFYQACLTAGVPAHLAIAAYVAVTSAGPSWGDEKAGPIREPATNWELLGKALDSLGEEMLVPKIPHPATAKSTPDRGPNRDLNWLIAFLALVAYALAIAWHLAHLLAS